jgi:hypothetical protein
MSPRTFGLPAAVSYRSGKLVAPLNWHHEYTLRTPRGVFHVFDADVPISACAHSIPSVENALSCGYAVEPRLAVRANCSKVWETTFGLTGEIRIDCPGDVSLHYQVEGTVTQNPEGAVGSDVSVSPCKAVYRSPVPSTAEAKRKARWIHENYPDTRHGMIVVKRSLTPFTEEACCFSGTTLGRLQSAQSRTEQALMTG